jgi:hypothetical protein
MCLPLGHEGQRWWVCEVGRSVVLGRRRKGEASGGSLLVDGGRPSL